MIMINTEGRISTEDRGLNSTKAQFKLWYQPVYETTNGNILHHEVLLRWLDQDGRVYLPHEFLPQISRAKMLKRLDYLVIRKAISSLTEQPNSCFSINLSQQALDDTSIITYIQVLLENYKVKPQQLSFELKEKSAAENLSSSITLVRELKALGCSITLDEFSNSMLTFSQCEKLPIDLIKIDGRLIQNLMADYSNQSLVKTIADISQMSGRVSIAKSVAYDTGPKMLQDIGIFCGQGHYLKPPSSHINTATLVNVLDTFVDSISRTDLLKELKYGVVFTPNVDHLMKLKREQEFRKIYSAADYKVCDSQILLYASKFLGTPIKEKISGSDFFPDFCDYHKDNQDIKVFLLGGSDQKVANQAQLNINQKIGRKIIIDTYSPPFKFENDEAENLKIIETINQSDATVLAVGVGAPKQEKWIVKHRDKLPNIKIFLAVGATINFEAGSVNRAPTWMSNSGMEWLYRLLAEPKRLWKRYLMDDLPFLGLILKQKLHTVEQLLSSVLNGRKRRNVISPIQLELQSYPISFESALPEAELTKPS